MVLFVISSTVDKPLDIRKCQNNLTEIAYKLLTQNFNHPHLCHKSCQDYYAEGATVHPSLLINVYEGKVFSLNLLLMNIFCLA